MNNTISLASIAIFASGTGSNAKKIIETFKNNPHIKISLIVCNNPTAGVIKIATQNKIDILLIEKEIFLKGDAYLPQLINYGINFIVLAGFLWKIPSKIINAFPNKIINIHPALLPKYGGKGMYGNHVHKAVVANKEKETGITIHYVDEIYDHGNIIFQAKCLVDENDTPEIVAQKIHLLEQAHFSNTIEMVLQMQNQR